ncbi:MAG: SRPBCC family protein [Actinomycetia bacterium]|nr:SRPBCC family protein [Actinomycetes bacterium]
MNGSVTEHIEATPDAVWALVSDITRTGEFSPETFEAEWLGGATEPDVGVKFRGHVLRNGRPPAYWTVCRITSCEPGRVFAFDVLGPGDRVMNSWRYELEPSGSGTDVTESFRLPANLPTKAYWALFGRARGKTNERGMRETLGRIRAVAESP